MAEESKYEQERIEEGSDSYNDNDLFNHGKNHEASPEMIKNKSSRLLKNNLAGISGKRSARVSFGLNSNKPKKISNQSRGREERNSNINDAPKSKAFNFSQRDRSNND